MPQPGRTHYDHLVAGRCAGVVVGRDDFETLAIVTVVSGVVTNEYRLALVFYVVYTLWFGFGIMYTFEGLGMQMEH